jgi:hypothetical protein
LILFALSEIGPAENQQGVSELWPGFPLLGLQSPDDFLVKKLRGTIPAVPVDPQYLESLSVPGSETNLERDARFVGKIKWRLKPLVFDGDARRNENCASVNHEQHAQLVRFWNDTYPALKQSHG